MEDDPAKPYYEAVGRLALETARTEEIARRLVVSFCLRPTGRSPAPGDSETKAAIKRAKELLKENPRGWKLPRIRAAIEKVTEHEPAELKAQRNAIFDELKDLFDERHEHVHRVLLAYHRDRKELLLVRDGRPERPDLEAMRRTTERIRELTHDLTCLSVDVEAVFRNAPSLRWTSANEG